MINISIKKLVKKGILSDFSTETQPKERFNYVNEKKMLVKR